MNTETLVRNRSKLVAHIESASDLYPNSADWPTLRERVLNEYPSFNSHSLVEVECPVCHHPHEVQLCHLYEGKFICISCHVHTKVHPAASVPEARRKANLTSGNIVKARTPEARRKANINGWVTRKSS